MRTHENQITDYPKGARVEAIREIPLSSPSQNYYADPLPQGTRGVVTAHTDDGRAWINFDGHGQECFGHTFEQPERYIRVVCTHRDDSCPANHEQPRPEQVGGECAEDCHFGDHDDYDIEQERIKFQKELGAAMVKAGAREVELDGPAAPERGERNDKMYSKSSRQTGQHVHFCMFCGQSGTELSNKQHSTLIEQRERLLDLVKQLREFVCLSTWGKMVRRPLAREAEGLVKRIDSMLTTIEQEGTQGR